jgi:hypothetical protein
LYLPTISSIAGGQWAIWATSFISPDTIQQRVSLPVLVIV